jgi:hypothetical protein
MTPSKGKLPIAKGARPAPKLSVDPIVVEALVAPLPLELLLRSLRRQPTLVAPAKLVLSCAGEPGVLAEIPRNGDHHGCEMRVREAIDRALAWLEEKPEATAEGNEAVCGSESIAEALADLPWDWERGLDGSYRVNVAEDAVSCRVRVSSISASWLHVSTSSAVKVQTSRTARALRIFALEASRRVRLARLSVTAVRQGSAAICWDSVLPVAARLDLTLTEALAAVVSARAETARSLRALSQPRIAEAYLSLRAPADAPRDRTLSE